MTLPAPQQLEDRIAGMFDMAEGIAFGRGCAALYALFAALARRHGPGEVVVPAICCETVPLAALYAGHAVRIADVSPATLGLAPETLTPMMSARTRAVVVVHVFGLDAGAAAFASLRARWPEVAFIEDIAHAAGGRSAAGTLLGDDLDYTLLSFAGDKILPGDGGMLLRSSRAIDRGAIRAAAAVSPRSPHHDLLALSLRNLVHALADLWRTLPSAETTPAFRAVAGAYRPLIAYDGTIGAPDALGRAFDQIETQRQRRLARYRRYHQGIAPRKAKVFAPAEGGMYWRCPMLLPTREAAVRTTAALRAQGIHASNHYFPLHKLFGGTCPVAEDTGARILNLWVAETATDDMIRRAIDIINSG